VIEVPLIPAQANGALRGSKADGRRSLCPLAAVDTVRGQALANVLASIVYSAAVAVCGGHYRRSRRRPRHTCLAGVLPVPDLHVTMWNSQYAFNIEGHSYQHLMPTQH
jgi:hypothetical protein